MRTRGAVTAPTYTSPIKPVPKHRDGQQPNPQSALSTSLSNLGWLQQMYKGGARQPQPGSQNPKHHPGSTARRLDEEPEPQSGAERAAAYAAEFQKLIGRPLLGTTSAQQLAGAHAAASAQCLEVLSASSPSESSSPAVSPQPSIGSMEDYPMMMDVVDDVRVPEADAVMVPTSGFPRRASPPGFATVPNQLDDAEEPRPEATPMVRPQGSRLPMGAFKPKARRHSDPERRPSAISGGNAVIGTREYYAADAGTRPPYSYSAIIYYAMKETGEARVQLGQIYSNIMQMWEYYKARPHETGWKNSIRHNLTVCRCFRKVARSEGETGKGGYWEIDEEAAKSDITLTPRDSSPRVPRKVLGKKLKRTSKEKERHPLKPAPVKSSALRPVQRVAPAAPVEQDYGALPAMLAATWPGASIGIEHDDSGFPAHMLEGALIPQPTNSPRPVGHSTRVMLLDDDGNHGAGSWVGRGALNLNQSFGQSFSAVLAAGQSVDV